MTEERKLELRDFNFSVRLTNGLYDAGIHTLEDLLKISYGQLAAKFRSIGKKTADELRSKLAYHGLALYGESIVTGVEGLAFIKDIPKKMYEIKQELSKISWAIESLQDALSKITALEYSRKRVKINEVP